eukprot:1324587-Ditylum_brightwellii.AAC.1
MEDEYYMSDNKQFIAIFDGHGGSAVSKYLRQNLYANLQAALPALTSLRTSSSTNHSSEEQNKGISKHPPSVQDYKKALQSAFTKVNKE